MSGNQANNIQILDGGLPRSIEATDNLQWSASVELTSGASMIIDGNLTVRGTTITENTSQLMVADNHIFINAGYTTVAAQTGGLVVNYLPTSLTDTVAATGFVAGVAAVSNPTVKTTGTATFSVGQLIQISGASKPSNNGLFEVLTHTGTTLTIRGIGTTNTVEDFTDYQFIADTTVAGTITRVTISVLRAGTDGVWETAAGASTGLTFVDLATGATVTLQVAYDNDVDGGNATITTNATDGSVVIAGTESLWVTATNGINLDTQFDFDGTVFDVLMTSGGFSIDGVGASNVSVTGGNLTLSTITSGTLFITAVAALTASGTAVSIDGTAASYFKTTGANLTLQTVTSGTLAVTSAGAVNIDGAAASYFKTTAANLTLQTVTSGTLFITAVAALTASGTAVSIDGTSASYFKTTGANLTLQTVTSGTLAVTSAGAVNIDGAAASYFKTTGANLTLQTVTSGSLLLTSAGDSTYSTPASSTTAFKLTDGSNNWIVLDSTNASLNLPKFVNILGEGVGVRIVTDDALVLGNVVRVATTTGNVGLADADTGSLRDGWVAGVSTGTFSGTATAKIVTTHGSLIGVKFAAAPAAASNGLPVYLSSTAGQGTLTAPSGNTVVTFIIGVLQGANGSTTTPNVFFRPQFISKGPLVT